LTERAVARAKARKAKYEISCSLLTGFMLRVLPSGKKAYYVRYRDDTGKDLRIRLGGTTELSFAEAKRLAAAKLGHVGARAEAPTATPTETEVAKKRPAPRTPLFRDFSSRFLREYAKPRLKPNTQQHYRRCLSARLVPHFGDQHLDQISFADIAGFHAAMSEKPYMANNSLVIISSIYSRAIEWGVLPRDFMPPTRGVKKFKEKSRERFLTPKERAQLDRFLGAALEVPRGGTGHIAWGAVSAIRLLAMTGMRRTEICDLTWEMVDDRHRCFRLPDSKTGQKIVPVSSRVLDLVQECRGKWETCSFNPKPRFVLYSRNGRRLEPSSLSRTWCTGVRDRIPGLEGVRLHDLRHSMASDAIMSGVPLAVVGKILGHRKPETTARYAHIADTVLNDAVEMVAETIHRSTKTGKRQKK
jgi:integrase